MTNRLGKGDQTRIDMELVAKKLLDNSELCFPECVQSLGPGKSMTLTGLFILSLVSSILLLRSFPSVY